jgi:hypothetical protein
MAEVVKIEKLATSDLANLRNELIKSKMDSWQAAELVSSFLVGRGYGVDKSAVRNVVPGIEVLRGSHDAMQAVLETVAYVM